MKRKQHLIQHPPSPAMSLKQELRKLSDLFRDCKDPDTAIRLTKRMDAVRKQIKPPVKKSVGRPKKVKPEPVKTIDDIVAEIERERRKVAPVFGPSPVEQQAAQLHAKAETQRAKEEAIENPPITAPQSNNLKTGDGAASPKQPALASRELVDMFKVVTRPLEDGEVYGSVGLTNALHSVYDRQPDHPVEPIEGGYLSDGFGSVKR